MLQSLFCTVLLLTTVTSVVGSTDYIEGYNVDVYINATSDTVKEHDNFTFTCSASTDMNVMFNISIDNSTTSDKYNQLIAGMNEDNSQNFTFIDTTYLDDGTTFECIANDTWKSSILPMSVLYPPIYSEFTEIAFSNGSNVTLMITDMRANPPVTSFTWEFEGKLLSNTSRIHLINATTIQFTPVTQDDIGNYTVTANNTEGSGEGMIEMDVYFVKSSISTGSPTTSIIPTTSANPIISTTQMIPTSSTTPTTPNSKKSHGGAIAAGILVPLFVIVLVIIIVGTLFYCWRKKRTTRSGFIPLSRNDEEEEPLVLPIKK